MTLVWGVMVLLFSSCGDTKIKHDSKNKLRPPAYPLVTIDPYTSGWAFSDCLYDAPVKHWTGKDFPLIGVAKVDGQVYRFMGAEDAEFTTLAGTSEQSLWSGNILPVSRRMAGKTLDLMIIHGKKERRLSVRWIVSLLPEPNGEKNISGYAVSSI